MGKTIAIFLLAILFLAGCDGQTNVLGKRQSKVEAILTEQNINTAKYTLKRSANGVFIYTDNEYKRVNTTIPKIYYADEETN